MSVNSNRTTFGQLEEGAPLVGSDIFAIQRTDGKNYKITADELAVFIGGGGGGGNINTINGDSTADQIFLAGTGLIINNAGATHTYLIGNHTHQDPANGGQLVATLALTATGTKDSTTFLRGDDTWAVPVGGAQSPWTSNIDAAGFNLFNLEYAEDNSTNPATVGFVRMGDGIEIAWRNAANDDNRIIYADDADLTIENFEGITFDGSGVVDFSGVSELDAGSAIVRAGSIELDTFFATSDIPAVAGRIRLENADLVAWRNFANSADISLQVNTSDQFFFNSELNVGNNLIKALADPVDGSDAATKTYVDNLVNGLSWKNPARVATTGDITLSGNQTIDGVATATDDRVLVKSQTDGSENGVYASAAGAWARTEDTDSESDLVNMSIYITEGSTLQDTSWVLTTDPPIVVDTTVLNYAQVGAGSGSPLTTKGDLFGYDTANARIPVGTNGQVLEADSAQALGVKWATPAVGGQTPWAQNIDGAGFDLTDAGLVQADTIEIINAGAGANPTITSNSINQQFLFTGNLTIIGKATFNPDATNAGINVGGQADPDPTNPINGDIVYNFTTNKFRAYENATWVDMIGGGVTALSGLTIDVTKNWATFGMTNFGVLSFDAPATSDPGQSDSISMQTGAFNPDMVFHVNANNSAYQFFIGSAGTAQYTFKNNTLDMSGAGLTNPGNFLDSNNNELLRWEEVASAVNYLEIENAATGNAPIFRVGAFGDANVGLEFQSRGTGNILFQNQSQELFELIHPSGSLANYMTITPSITANGPILASTGTDTNVDLNIDTKGTGEINMLSNVDFGNNNIANAIFTSGIVVAVPITWNEFRQTFNPNATLAGINVGQHTAEPSVPVAGDIFYDSTADAIKGYIAGSTNAFVDLGAGGSSGDVVGPGSATDQAVALFDGVTGKLIKNSDLNYDFATTKQLTIPGPIIFSAAGTVPAGTNSYIREDGVNMDINVASASSIILQFGGAGLDWVFTSGGLDGSAGTITNVVLDTNVTLTNVDVLVASGLGAGITYGNGIKQTFNPSGSNAGINIGSNAGEPATPVDGDLVYDTNASAGEEFKARINGAWVSLGVAAGGEFNGPYTADTDFAGYHQDNVGAVNFELTGPIGGLPAITEPYISWDDALTPDAMLFNIPTGAEFLLTVNGTEEYKFSATTFDMNQNTITNAGNITQNTLSAVGLVQFGRSNEVTAQDAVDMRFNAGNTRYGELIVQMVSAVSGSEIGEMEFLIKNDNTTTMDSLLRLTGGATATAARINLGAALGTNLDMDDNLLLNVNQIRMDNVIAQSGFLRMNNAAEIAWRNNAGTADHKIYFNASDQFIIQVTSSNDYLFTETALLMQNNALESVGQIQDGSQNAQLDFGSVASAVNYIVVTNAATATPPIIAAEGTDANIDLEFRAKGEGSMIFADNDGNEELLELEQISGAATNHIKLINALTANGPTIIPEGTTNIDLNIDAKGTGVINMLSTVDLGNNELDNIKNLIHDLSTSGTDVDFTEDQLQEISIAANTTFTGTGYAIGKSKTIKITTDGTLRTLAFPAGWVFVGTKPTDQAANKEGILTLTCFTAAEAGVIAAYSVET